MAVVGQTVGAGPADSRRLRLTEVFLSLQGETTFSGLPTVFVRLTGCPLRCQYCDTAYAFHGGTTIGLDGLLEQVHAFGVRHVCVTGGEPLAQKGCLLLLKELCDLGHAVSLETSGAMDISAVDPRVSRILDIKTPGSGEENRNRWENLAVLGALDQVKFVICDRVDYDWAKAIALNYQLPERHTVLFSPSHEQLEARQLADWLVADRFPVRLQVQLHKYLWGNERGR